ncbi:hypothetical protein N665_6118s0001 [Sinapis alba]|nr:hypothetical protein N665_6118s0001 [Sinapis alba]
MDKVEYLNELQVAAEKLIHSSGVLFLVTLFLKWVTSFTAILLLILDGTKWKSTNMWTSLLATYLFVSLPLVIFQFLRTELMKWIALLTVVLKAFPPKPRQIRRWHIQDQCAFLRAFTFLIITLKSCGGYKNSFTQKEHNPYTICLWLLSVYSLWSFFLKPYFLS